MKVLGCKVDDSTYERFSRLGNISEHLRKAIEIYLNTKQGEKTPVNHLEKVVNHKEIENKYQNIRDKVDALKKRFQ